MSTPPVRKERQSQYMPNLAEDYDGKLIHVLNGADRKMRF